MTDPTPITARNPRASRFRNWLANIPVLSLLVFRYRILYGSTVIDWSRTLRGAERRARAFVNDCPRPLHAWNSIQVQRFRWDTAKRWRSADNGRNGDPDA